MKKRRYDSGPRTPRLVFPPRPPSDPDFEVQPAPERQLSIPLSDQALARLQALRDSGLFGVSVESTAQQLIYRALWDMQRPEIKA